ncbi:hypothetical protein ABK040_007253 [Willaertia magna]
MLNNNNDNFKFPKFHSICLSLYIELILDCSRKSNIESVSKLKTIFEWIIKGVITKDEFSKLFSKWTQLQSINISDLSNFNEISKISEDEWNTLMKKNFNEKELTTISELLINEQNKYLMEQWNCNNEWLHMSEELFYCLDCDKLTILSIDDILILVLSLFGESERISTPELLFKKCFLSLKEAPCYNGVLTLRRFRQLLHNNKLDIETITSTISRIETNSNYWKQRYGKYSMLKDSSNLGLWKQSVLDTKVYFTGDTDTFKYPKLEQFLLNESFSIRFEISYFFFEEQASFQLFQEFVKQYSLKDILYEDSLIKTHPCFLFIDKTIKRYLILIQDMINNILDFYSSSEKEENVEEISPFSGRSSAVSKRNNNNLHIDTKEISSNKIDLLETPSSKTPSILKSPVNFFVKTRSNNLQQPDISLLGRLSVKLPFDVEAMVRRAEWIDIKPSTVFDFQYLKTRKSLKPIHTFQELQVQLKQKYEMEKEMWKREHIGTTSNELFGNRTNTSMNIKVIHSLPKSRKTSSEIPKWVEGWKKDVVDELLSKLKISSINEGETLNTINNDVTINTLEKKDVVKSDDKDQNEGISFNEEEIESEVNKFINGFILNPSSLNNKSDEEDATDEDTLKFHELLYKHFNERKKLETTNESQEFIDPETSFDDLRSHPKEYQEEVNDFIHLDNNDSAFISPTIPIKLMELLQDRGIKEVTRRKSIPNSVTSSNINHEKELQALDEVSVLSSVLEDSEKVLEHDSMLYSPIQRADNEPKMTARTIPIKLTDFIGQDQLKNSKRPTTNTKTNYKAYNSNNNNSKAITTRFSQNNRSNIHSQESNKIKMIEDISVERISRKPSS